MKRISIRLISIILTLAMLFCVMPVGASAAERDLASATDAATRLKQLGLFQGVGTLPDGGTNFDLNRPATRVEALVMLIRLLGEESEANAGSWKHPFTDVPSWADKDVGYAYEKGLTKGSSGTTFGTGNASAQMYLTFVLRALGYSDAAGGDFTWDKTEELEKQVAILTDEVMLDDFLRADAVLVSEAALCAQVKGSTVLLLDKLIDAGVFTGSEWDAAYPDSPVRRGNGPSGGTPEYDKDPITLVAGARTFTFTIVNVDEMAELYLSDGSYSGPDWQSTDKGWVKFEIKPNGLTTSFSCYTDVDFENVPDLKIRYTKREGTNTAYFGCTIKNGGRYWLDELAQQLMTEK